MKLGIIHASRGRPIRGIDSAKQLVANMTSGVEFSYIFSLDTDDPCLDQYHEPLKSCPFVTKTIIEANSGGIEAQNRAATHMTDEDVIMVHTDDIRSPMGWDTSLLSLLPDQEVFLIHINNVINSSQCAIVPIISMGLYKKLGYIFYPEYISMFADNDLYQTALRLNCVYTGQIDFVHEHPCWGMTAWDDTYHRTNRPQSYSVGQQVFSRRASNNFDIPLS